LKINKRGDSVKWIRLLKQKFNGHGGLIPKEDLDTILGDYTSLADFPCAVFAEDLIAAYPDAKVILSVRDSPDVWWRSFNDTVWRYHQRKVFPSSLRERIEAMIIEHTKYSEIMRLIAFNTPMASFLTQGQQWYLDHNEMVRKSVPQDRLLEFNAKQGWGPLCEFLGVDKPDNEYPMTNNTGTFQRAVDGQWRRWRMKKKRDWFHLLSVCMLVLAIILGVLDIKDRGSFNKALASNWISVVTQW
jgi:hypothetical protein